MILSRLQTQIKKILRDNAFNVMDESINDESFIFIVNFNNILKQSTFYINKKNDTANLIIGANITLNDKILTKSIANHIKELSKQFDISCSLPKYNKSNINSIVIQNTYKCLKFKSQDFMTYVYNFQHCMEAIYIDIEKYLDYQDTQYLDLSMFEEVDWSIFDPYKYIVDRDQYFDGSWTEYLDFLHTHDNVIDYMYIKICKAFEENNNIPIDLACEYIIEKIIQYSNINREYN